MIDSELTSSLEMRWIAVTDERGRTRMEARWVDTAAAAQQHPHAA